MQTNRWCFAGGYGKPKILMNKRSLNSFPNLQSAIFYWAEIKQNTFSHPSLNVIFHYSREKPFIVISRDLHKLHLLHSTQPLYFLLYFYFFRQPFKTGSKPINKSRQFKEVGVDLCQPWHKPLFQDNSPQWSFKRATKMGNVLADRLVQGRAKGVNVFSENLYLLLSDSLQNLA